MKRAIYIILALILIWGIVTPIGVIAANPQAIRTPDISLQVTQWEAYLNYYELNGQLYLIRYVTDYTTNPATTVNAAFIFRLLNAVGVELGNTVAYSSIIPEYGFNTGLAAIYFPPASAPTWAGAYSVKLEGNPTLQWMGNTATTAMLGAIADDGGVQTDETAASNSAVANDMTLLPAVPAVNDAYYFGSNTMFDILTLNIGTIGNGTWTITWEGWNSATSTWEALTGVTDGTNGFRPAGAGNYNVTFTTPTNWGKTTVSGINAYWIRARVSAYTAVVAQPLGTQSWVNSISPPYTTNAAPSLWYPAAVGGTVADTSAQVTTRIRMLLGQLQVSWTTPTLYEDTASGRVFTSSGEEYFTNTIPYLRTACPTLFAVTVGDPSYTSTPSVRDYYVSGADSQELMAGNDWLAQTFTASSNYSVDGVWIRAYRVTNPGTLTASIRNTAAGLPTGTGTNLVSGTYDASLITNNTVGYWYHIPFTADFALSNGSTYSIVMGISGIAPNELDWSVNTAGAYTGGQACSSNDGGNTWAAIAGNDFMFLITATGASSQAVGTIHENRLTGTIFDPAPLAAAIDPALSPLWVSSVAWMFVSVVVGVLVGKFAGNYKWMTFPICLMVVYGGWLGFMAWAAAISIGLVSAAVGVWLLFGKTAY